MTDRYFPQGIASNNTFCNRDHERGELKASIKAHEHTVLVAPRRYGKTSLITQVLNETNAIGISIDFFLALTQTEVKRQIAEGASQLITQLLPKAKTTSEKIIERIKSINPKLTFNLLGKKLEIDSKQTSEKSISELLLALDQFAIKVNKTCVLVLDEFQQIGELDENHAIEAAIRHSVERSQNVSYIFCGSKRHLLNEMFSDKSRPLYHACDLMSIDRISTPCYQKFLNENAKRRWRKTLHSDVTDEIIYLAANHPYYINALCRRLWRQDKPPTLSQAQQAWSDYVEQQSPWIITDISNLTLNRRKVITALALHPTKTPQGQTFSQQSDVSPASIKKSLDYLRKMDMVYQDKNNTYQVLDPVVAYFLRERS